MAIGRRSRTLPPSYYNSSARSLSQRSFGMPSRNPLSFGGRSGRASSMYDTRGDDYALFDRVSDVSYLSNAALDESDDTVRRSRGRDAMLLRNANNAIVSSESYATPQASVAARRVARGRSLAPRAASVPPRPYVYPSEQKLTSRKAIRTDDGYSKPKNLLSWQYRLDSLVNPTDVIYQPSSYIRIKEQIRNAQERMDKHRQMIDRYLPEEGEDTGDVASKIRRKMAEMEKRDALSRRRRDYEDAEK